MHKLRTIITFLILVASIPEMQAQKKCKYKVDKVDPISGERLRESSPFSTLLSQFKFSLIRSDNSFKIQVELFFGYIADFDVTTTDQLILKFSTGETHTLYPARKIEPMYLGLTTNYFVPYDVRAEIFRKISDSGLDLIRFNVNGKSYDLQMKNKLSEKVSRTASCLLQN